MSAIEIQVSIDVSPVRDVLAEIAELTLSAKIPLEVRQRFVGLLQSLSESGEIIRAVDVASAAGANKPAIRFEFDERVATFLAALRAGRWQLAFDQRFHGVAPVDGSVSGDSEAITGAPPSGVAE